MPSFTFNDSENKVFEPLPPGDYIARVTECEFTLSKGRNTNGRDQMELVLVILDKEGKERKVFETLIFHESCGWKVDTFAKSFNLLIGGQPPRKGEAIEWSENMVVGLRGWVTLNVEEYNGKKRNRVAVFITNKEKFAKLVDVGEAAAVENDDPFA